MRGRMRRRTILGDAKNTAEKMVLQYYLSNLRYAKVTTVEKLD